MDLRQLRYFVAVAEELHFGRAAKRLHISQPALSFDIKKFETQLGVQLLARTNKRVALTGAGALLLEQARGVLAQADEAERLVRRSARGLAGRLRVGFVNSMLFRGLPDAVARFREAHPRIDVVLKEMNSGEQLAALTQRRLDLGCAHAGRCPDEIASRSLLIEPFLCCLPADHTLADADTVDLAALADAPFVLFPRAVSPHYHDRIVALCVAAGFSPEIRHEVRLWQTVVTMVAYGMGVALVPRALARAGGPHVRFVPLAGDGGRSEIRLLHRAEPTEPGVEAFAEALSAAVTAACPPTG